MEREPDVGAAFPHGGDHTIRAVDRNHEIDSGVTPAETRDHLGQEVRHQRLDGMDMHVATPQSLQSVDFRTHLLDLAQAGSRKAQQDFAGGRQLDTARMSLEQRRAQMLLELLDLPAESGLRDMQFLCRFPKSIRCAPLLRNSASWH